MNWKTQTAAAIVTHEAPAAQPDSQQALANSLAALIDAGIGPICAERF